MPGGGDLSGSPEVATRVTSAQRGAWGRHRESGL